MIEKLNPEDLILDCQIRYTEDATYIRELREILTEAGAYTLPPVRGMRYGDGVHVTDGNHRTIAAAEAGLTEIDVELIDGNTREEAIADAINASRQNLSLRFTDLDRFNAFRVALETYPDYSTRRIAEMIGIPHTTADRWRQKVDKEKAIAPPVKIDRTHPAPAPVEAPKRVGKDGKQYAVKPVTVKCAACGTVTAKEFAENAPDSTWQMVDGRWYCCDDCIPDPAPKPQQTEEPTPRELPKASGLILGRDMEPALIAAHLLRFYRDGDDKSKPLEIARVLMRTIAPEELVEG